MAYQRPISKYQLTSELSIDIRYQKVHPNIVSEYEAMEAAVFGGYTWMAFTALQAEEQAVAIAHYRMHNRIDSVVQQEITRYTKAKQHGR